MKIALTIISMILLAGGKCGNNQSPVDLKTKPMVSLGYSYGCFLSSVGLVRCFGLGSETEKLFPEPTPGELSQKGQFVALSLNAHQACAVSSQEKLFCWDVFSSAANFDPVNTSNLKANELSIGGDGRLCFIDQNQKLACIRSIANIQTNPPPGGFQLVAAGFDSSSPTKTFAAGITASGGLSFWKPAIPDFSSVKQDRMKRLVTNSVTPNLFSAVSINGEPRIFRVDFSQPAPFEGSLAQTKFSDLAANYSTAICGIVADSELPVCFRKPAADFGRMSNEDLANERFSKISVGADNVSGDVMCGIRADATVKCWKSPLYTGYPKGVPADLALP